jgi:hypothetical protein
MIERVKIERHAEDDPAARWRASIGISHKEGPQTWSEPRTYGGYGSSVEEAVTDLAETLGNVLSFEVSQRGGWATVNPEPMGPGFFPQSGLSTDKAAPGSQE